MSSIRFSKEITAGITAAALECSLCTKRFTHPKSLPCMHSFCLECLEKLRKESNEEISCPICREVFQVPTGGLKHLEDSVFINGLLDYVTNLEQKLAPTCVCCKKEAAFICQDCGELYCGICKDTHRRMKISKDHSIITLKEYNSIDPVERFASKRVNCSQHSMPLLFFCDTDKTPVCVGCTQVQHPRGEAHKIIDIKNAFETFSSVASELITSSDMKVSDVREKVDVLKRKRAAVNLNYSKCKADVIRQADELHLLISRHKEDQLQRLEETHKQKLMLFETQVNELELAIAKLSSMSGIIDNLTKSPNQVMALMKSSDASERLDTLLNDKVNTEPQELTVLYYKLNSRLSQLLATKVVDRLRGNETIISPKNTTIEIQQEGGRAKLPLLGNKCKLNTDISVKIRNYLGEMVYNMDVKVKCLGINRSLPDKIIIEEISVIFDYDGCYHIRGDVAFNNCTLICLIIDRSDVYVNTIKFDKHGMGSTRESHFTNL
ncbi:tripartite motif-containing protein 45-like [Anneissia japonica]|uniref:tripartite motif-containing protein 45-like n=1 Tax=Anneissia japonica TaxID=1529436 RepID=UPI0014258374|nr:tripartite motif-containing protein 45-like [Anneissia japonica]